MNGNNSERLSQEGECYQDGESGILERASAFAHRVLEEIETLAGTTSCKSVQLVRLKKWAQEQDCWFSDCSQFGDYFDRGSENEVYLFLTRVLLQKRKFLMNLYAWDSVQKTMVNIIQTEYMTFLML